MSTIIGFSIFNRRFERYNICVLVNKICTIVAEKLDTFWAFFLLHLFIRSFRDSEAQFPSTRVSDKFLEMIVCDGSIISNKYNDLGVPVL